MGFLSGLEKSMRIAVASARSYCQDPQAPSKDDLNKFAANAKTFVENVSEKAKNLLGHQYTKAAAGVLIYTGAALLATGVGGIAGVVLVGVGVGLATISTAITNGETASVGNVHVSLDESGDIAKLYGKKSYGLGSSTFLSLLATVVPPAAFFLGERVGVHTSYK